MKRCGVHSSRRGLEAHICSRHEGHDGNHLMLIAVGLWVVVVPENGNYVTDLEAVNEKAARSRFARLKDAILINPEGDVVERRGACT